jgi:hypothetical protein
MFLPQQPNEGKHEYIKTLAYRTVDGLSPTLLAHICLKIGNELKSEGWDDLTIQVETTKESVIFRLSGVRVNGK